jgi:hypothetical protein
MAQRVVIVVAIGIALAVTGSYLVSLGSGFHVGWTGIASLAMWPPGAGLSSWVRLIIWLGLTGIWASASVFVLRSPRGPAEPDWRPVNRES